MSLLDRLKKALGTGPAKPAPAIPIPPPEPEPEPIQVPQVEPATLKAELESGSAPLLVDVRRANDYTLEHIAGALSIPIDGSPDKLLELDKNANLVVYCYQGYTSLDAAGYLIEHGFKNVRSLKGGITLWRIQGGLLEEKYKSARL